MTAIRSMLYNVWFFGTLAVCLAGLWTLFLFPYTAMLAAIRLWVRVALWGLKVIVGLDWTVRGMERLPDGPVIIASKHQSAWDTAAPLLLFKNAAWVMKLELSWLPLWGWYAHKCGAIFVDRKAGLSALKTLVAEARDRLAKGRSILIFPEGTRRAPGEPPAYAPGVAALYAQLNVPVVPVALNSGVFWGRRSFFKKPGTIVIEVLDPIEPGMDRKAFMKELQGRIEPATDKLVAEAEATLA